MDNCKIALIEWVDSSQPISEWKFLDDEFLNDVIVNLTVFSVGFIVKEDDNNIVLCQGYIPEHKELRQDKQANGVAVIPKCSIKSITTLEKSKSNITVN